MSLIRATAVAGAFYPADKNTLKQAVDGYLGDARLPGNLPSYPKVIVAPHAGYVYSGPVAGTVYATLLSARGKINKVVLIGPSHRVGFRGLALCTADFYATPLGDIPIDKAAIASLSGLPRVGFLDAAHSQEHSLEVQLPFLKEILGDFSLIPVVAGAAEPEEVAALLDALWGGDDTLLVISTDLSHYLDYKTAQISDAKITAAIETLDMDAIGEDQACGRVPLRGLLSLARKKGLKPVTLDVRNSGDTAGSKDRVVGYGAWAFYEINTNKKELLDLAWASIKAGLKNGKPLSGHDFTGKLQEMGAAFVTLKKKGELRGCIGSPMAWRGLGEDIVDNAFKAAFADPRFSPLREGELDDLTLSISVLTQPYSLALKSEDDLLSQLRPGVDGLIIEDAGRRALFLPAVWEQLPNPKQFLAHLKQKAGLPINHWSNNFKASVFQAVEYK